MNNGLPVKRYGACTSLGDKQDHKAISATEVTESMLQRGGGMMSKLTIIVFSDLFFSHLQDHGFEPLCAYHAAWLS